MKQAYQAKFNGQKIYFAFGYSGLRAAQRMAEILKVTLPLKSVRVGVSKVLIG